MTATLHKYAHSKYPQIEMRIDTDSHGPSLLKLSDNQNAVLILMTTKEARELAAQLAKFADETENDLPAGPVVTSSSAGERAGDAQRRKGQ